MSHQLESWQQGLKQYTVFQVCRVIKVEDLVPLHLVLYFQAEPRTETQQSSFPVG